MAYTMANKAVSKDNQRQSRERYEYLLHTAVNQKSIYPNIPDKPTVARTGGWSDTEPTNP